MYLVDDGRMTDVSDSRCYQTDDDQWYKEAQKLAEHIVESYKYAYPHFRQHTTDQKPQYDGDDNHSVGRCCRLPERCLLLCRLLRGFGEKGASFRGVCTALSRSKEHPFHLAAIGERPFTCSCKIFHL